MPRPRQRNQGFWAHVAHLWRTAEPSTRRNTYLGALTIGWAMYLVYDMAQLRQDPRLRQTLKMDDPDAPTLGSAVQERFNRVVRGKDAEDY